MGIFYPGERLWYKEVRTPIPDDVQFYAVEEIVSLWEISDIHADNTVQLGHHYSTSRSFCKPNQALRNVMDGQEAYIFRV